jgi:hypothetical protein
VLYRTWHKSSSSRNTSIIIYFWLAAFRHLVINQEAISHQAISLQANSHQAMTLINAFSHPDVSVRSVICMINHTCDQLFVWSAICAITHLCYQSSVRSVTRAISDLCDQLSVRSAICAISHPRDQPSVLSVIHAIIHPCDRSSMRSTPRAHPPVLGTLRVFLRDTRSAACATLTLRVKIYKK